MRSKPTGWRPKKPKSILQSAESGSRIDQKVVGAGIAVRGERGHGIEFDDDLGKLRRRGPQPGHEGGGEGGGDEGVVGKPVVHQRRHDLMPKASLDVLAHRCHPVARLLGDGAHARARGKPPEQVCRALQLRGRPRVIAGRHLGQPDRGRILVEVRHEKGTGHGQPRGEGLCQAGPVDAGFVGPGEGGIEGGTVFLRDHGGMEGGGKALDVLDDETDVAGAAGRGEGPAHPVPTGCGQRWQRVGVRRRDRGEQLHLLG